MDKVELFQDLNFYMRELFCLENKEYLSKVDLAKIKNYKSLIRSIEKQLFVK